MGIWLKNRLICRVNKTYNNNEGLSHSEDAGNGYLRAHLYKPDLGYRHKQVVGGDSRAKEIVL